MERVKLVLNRNYGNYIAYINSYKFTVNKPRDFSIIIDFDYGEMGRYGFYSLWIGDRDDICLYEDMLFFYAWDGHAWRYIEMIQLS